jgi:hypothetical protein
MVHLRRVVHSEDRLDNLQGLFLLLELNLNVITPHHVLSQFDFLTH